MQPECGELSATAHSGANILSVENSYSGSHAEIQINTPVTHKKHRDTYQPEHGELIATAHSGANIPSVEILAMAHSGTHLTM